ncbi:MAG: hypothetical protein M1834_009198 [Cirrosporium novae-zelandiae]|nr:MAG: hypothetical protein M1834_009198 [Cirrosporium novae-zelandiae]
MPPSVERALPIVHVPSAPQVMDFAQPSADRTKNNPMDGSRKITGPRLARGDVLTTPARCDARKSSLSQESGKEFGNKALQLLNSSSDLSQSTQPEILDMDVSLTPATTSSSFSSEDHQSQKLNSLRHKMTQDPLSPPNAIETIRRAASSSSPSNASATSITPSAPLFKSDGLVHGQKRTASGAVKSPSANIISCRGGNSGHSRTMSSSSNTNRMDEVLSAQLRTRLSYAMMKAQNGLEDGSPNEMESLMSQQSCSTSIAPITNQGNFYPSPRTSIATLGRELSSSSTNSTGRPNQNSYHAHRASAPIFPPSNQLPQTYETFWRDHPSQAPSPKHAAAQRQHSRPYLAPPVDILPGGRRRANQMSSQITSRNTQTHTTSPSSIAHIGATTLVPSTPPSASPQKSHVSRLQTPIQNNADREADAIETLLFMSNSPSNSAYNPATLPPPSSLPLTAPAPSPLRKQFPPTPRRTETTGSPVKPARKESVASATSSVRRKGLSASEVYNQFGLGAGFKGRRRRLTEQDVDRILDEMGDGSSDDDVPSINPLPTR